MTWWLIVFCVILLIIILLFSKIYVTINYSLVGDNQSGFLYVHFLQVPLYKTNLGKYKKKTYSILDKILKSKGNNLSDLVQEGKILLHTMPSLYWLLRKLYLHKFQWDTKVGAGEASSTGILSGGVWTVKGLVLAFLSNTTHVTCSLNINVIPYFQQEIFNSKIDVKFSIRSWQAVVGGFKIIRSFSKREKITIKLSEGKI